MIRKMKEEETTKIMTLWTKGNFKAHDFIDTDYWLLNFNTVKNEYLPNSDTYVYVENEEIKAFISIMRQNYIGALFVREDSKREGIGRKLINFCKEKYNELTLHVYEKNVNAMLFYVKMGFNTMKIQVDENTGEKEYVMEWKNKQ